MSFSVALMSSFLIIALNCSDNLLLPTDRIVTWGQGITISGVVLLGGLNVGRFDCFLYELALTLVWRGLTEITLQVTISSVEGIGVEVGPPIFFCTDRYF